MIAQTGGSGVLEAFIAENREEIVRRCRAKVATRVDPPPTDAEINHGVPLFLDHLAETLGQRWSSDPEIGAVLRGRDLLVQGFTVSQVVHDYGDLCQSITELAADFFGADDFRTLNQCLGDAIASAISNFGRDSKQNTEAQRRIDRFRDMWMLNRNALIAFEVIKAGSVGVGGATADLLYRSLMRMSSIIDRALAEDSQPDGTRVTPAGSDDDTLPRAENGAPQDALQRILQD